eukprot:GEMP01000366.1.p1 GENE.GEMP01000366.1~~GEMP01000366.1.p1  ORF type:complete len:898 (-),score=152.02 GEMP01000366.1:4658-7351(-)
MCPRILWFLLPCVALVLKGEPLYANVRPSNRGLAGRLAVRRLQDENIILTVDEIAQFTAEIKELKSWEAVKARYQGDEHEMFKRIAFRNEYVVLGTLHKIKENYQLQIEVPELEDVPGSRTITSDFDVSIRVPLYRRNSNDDDETDRRKFQESLEHLSDDVTAASLFVQIIDEEFGAFPGTVFDSNIYVRGLAGEFFRQTSSSIRPAQDIAALTKIRRYTTVPQWQTMLESMDAFHEDVVSRSLSVDQDDSRHLYHASRENFQVADDKTVSFQWLLFYKLGELEAGDATRMQQFQEAGSDMEHAEISAFIRGAETNLVLKAEYLIYLEGMTEVRTKQIELERIKLRPPLEGTTARREWADAKTNLRDAINSAIGDSMYFAPEAYLTEGAFGHVVRYEQAPSDASALAVNSNDRRASLVGRTIDRYERRESVTDRARVLATLSPLDMLCSMNEQAGDFFKDVNFHYRNEPEIALYQSSKYLMRFYNAIHLLNLKVDERINSGAIGSGRWDPLNIGDIRDAIAPLYQIRRNPVTEEVKRTAAAQLVADNSALGLTLGRNVEEISQAVLGHLAKVNAEYRSIFDLFLPVPPAGTTQSGRSGLAESEEPPQIPRMEQEDSGFADMDTPEDIFPPQHVEEPAVPLISVTMHAENVYCARTSTDLASSFADPVVDSLQTTEIKLRPLHWGRGETREGASTSERFYTLEGTREEVRVKWYNSPIRSVNGRSSNVKSIVMRDFYSQSIMHLLSRLYSVGENDMNKVYYMQPLLVEIEKQGRIYYGLMERKSGMVRVAGRRFNNANNVKFIRFLRFLSDSTGRGQYFLRPQSPTAWYRQLADNSLYLRGSTLLIYSQGGSRIPIVGGTDYQLPMIYAILKNKAQDFSDREEAIRQIRESRVRCKAI